ncbi:hypothetical protein E2C01_088739 [Portunus trituberculatus]|uniref:Uncharacterized protein n=1 Tax=Portunus trituberculatus TaxID=210409 RepID=A0A5B7JG96_PORTR|nr:hypothetical protein [Portunus trituberculatus]
MESFQPVTPAGHRSRGLPWRSLR